MNGELKGMWKEAVAQFVYWRSPRIFPEGARGVNSICGWARKRDCCPRDPNRRCWRALLHTLCGSSSDCSLHTRDELGTKLEEAKFGSWPDMREKATRHLPY